MYSFQVFLLGILLLKNFKVESKRNNACNSYLDYQFMDVSKNCYYTPDVYANSTQILKNHNKTYETYEVTTDDGYILTLFRLPHKNPKGVVILQHPVVTDSGVFLKQGNESTAFLFNDAGYDVWLPNFRGTPYSQRHINMTQYDFEFWDFSFHEIAVHDYSAYIKFISDITNNTNIIFIGQSMSATSAVIYASLKPEEAKKYVKLFILLAPVTYMKNVKDDEKYVAYLENILKFITNTFKLRDFMQGIVGLIFKLGERLIVELPLKYYIERVTVRKGGGLIGSEIDPKFATIAVSSVFQTFSWKIIYHYSQVFKTGRFQMYDYGAKINQKLYNSTVPPEYPLQNIEVPMYVIVSDSDVSATVEDADYFYQKLPNAARYGFHNISGIGHWGFHFSTKRKELIYDHILQLLATTINEPPKTGILENIASNSTRKKGNNTAAKPVQLGVATMCGIFVVLGIIN